MGRIKTKNTGDGEVKIALNEIGRIRTGIKAKNSSGKEYPKAIDYFKIDSIYKDSILKVLEIEKEEDLKQLDICFFSEDTDRVCNEEHELRDGSGARVLYGDGEAYHHWNAETNQWDTYDATDPAQKEYIDTLEQFYIGKGSKGIQSALTIKFLIIKFQEVLGYFQYYTKASKASIDNIIGPFDLVKKSAGMVSMIPFRLSISMHTSQLAHNIDGKQVKPKYPVVRMDPMIGQESTNQIRQLVQNNVAITGLLTSENVAEEYQSLMMQNDIKQIGGGNEE